MPVAVPSPPAHRWPRFRLHSRLPARSQLPVPSVSFHLGAGGPLGHADVTASPCSPPTPAMGCRAAWATQPPSSPGHSWPAELSAHPVCLGAVLCPTPTNCESSRLVRPEAPLLSSGPVTFPAEPGQARRAPLHAPARPLSLRHADHHGRTHFRPVGQAEPENLHFQRASRRRGGSRTALPET